MEYVNYDCRPGDVINLHYLYRRQNARVIATYSHSRGGVRLQFNDGSEGNFSYKLLKQECAAFYVAKCEPVEKPEPFGL